MPYDEESGLVFNETIVSGQPRHEDSCLAELHSYGGSKIPFNTFPNGARGLFGMAMRLILCHLDSLESNTIKALPKPIQERIWDAVVLACSDTLPVWKMFVNTGNFNMLTKNVAAGCSDCNPLDLGAIVPLISSPSLNWITHLSLGRVSLSKPEVIRIASLTSLRALSLGTGTQRERLPIDQIIREWAALAKERNALSNLQMVFLEVKTALSPWTFHYMNSLPALDTLALWSFADQHLLEAQSERYGWLEGESTNFFKHADNQNRITRRNAHGSLDWSDLVESYIESREVKNFPVLNARGGIAAWRECMFDDLVCFERDWDLQRRQASKLGEYERRGGEERPSKKRKLKDGKHHSLGDFLAGL